MTKEQVEKISQSPAVQDQLNRMIQAMDHALCVCCKEKASLVGMYVPTQEESEFLGGHSLDHKVIMYYTCLPCSGKPDNLSQAIWKQLDGGMARC